MGDLKDRLAQLSPKRLALVALELEERLAAAEGARREPVAVIGMACRVPGADTVEEYWRVLDEGVDAIRETPADRWDVDAYYDPDPDAPGKIATRWGGFLRDIQHFDPSFFGISRREAVSMDPQQRLLLEVAWEAFERAGQSADRLFSSATGVFVGACNADYLQGLMARDPSEIDAYLALGQCRERDLGPYRLRPRPAGARGHHRHRLLVVARRSACRVSEPAGGRLPACAGRRRERHLCARNVDGAVARRT